MTEHDRDDERIARWIGAVRAEAEQALWTRVRARIESGNARPAFPGWLEWMMRPAAPAVATVLLAVTIGAGWIALRNAEDSSQASTLTEALLDETSLDSGETDRAPGDSGVSR